MFQQRLEVLLERVAFRIISRFGCGGDGFVKEQIFERELPEVSGSELLEFKKDWEVGV